MTDNPEAVLASEKALLGAILLWGTHSKDALNDIVPIVQVTDFAIPTHQRIYKAMLQCNLPHELAVAQQLSQTSNLQKGDVAYLVSLEAFCPSCMDYLEYARQVATYASHRQGIRYQQTHRRGVE